MSKVVTYQQKIREAIDVIDSNGANPVNNGCECRQCQAYRKIRDFAIAALRAQIEPGEPCEWCKDDHSYSLNYGLGGDSHHFCASCGRRRYLLPSKSTQSGAIRSAGGDTP